ncbi:recombinase family protein [Kitasatospora sp. NPDC092039]|uniref:recombinase family protein n=1 Tax=Kitasatospora sp. NPDC092039 TaxID=3364086 RepID=UPI0037FAF22B
MATAPFGYNADRRTINEYEAAIIRELVARVFIGDKLRTLVRELNGLGIRTTTGGQWSVTTLKRLLCSGRISGQREHQPRPRSESKRALVGAIVATAVWPAIITPGETEKLRAILLAPERRLTSPTPRRCLCTGLLHCSLCGAGMCGRPREDGMMRYICNKMPGNNHCGKTFILADPTDAFVTAMAREALLSPQMAEQLLAEPGGPTEEDILQVMRACRIKLDELAADYAADTITRSEWLSAKTVLDERLATQRTALAETAPRLQLITEFSLEDAFDESFELLPLERKQALLHTVFDQVVVKPAVRGLNRFDPTRLEPVWKI